jgi:hypothetical protein
MSQALGMNKALGNNVSDIKSPTLPIKSFTEYTGNITKINQLVNNLKPYGGIRHTECDQEKEGAINIWEGNRAEGVGGRPNIYCD